MTASLCLSLTLLGLLVISISAQVPPNMFDTPQGTLTPQEHRNNFHSVFLETHTRVNEKEREGVHERERNPPSEESSSSAGAGGDATSQQPDDEFCHKLRMFHLTNCILKEQTDPVKHRHCDILLNTVGLMWRVA